MVKNFCSRVSFLIQRLFRPLIRFMVPRSWQYAFSAWVYSNARGPYVWLNAGHHWPIDYVLHRLYWLFNPRGEPLSPNLAWMKLQGAHWLRFRPGWAVGYAPALFVFVLIRGHLYFPLSWLVVLAKRVRMCFPYFYSITLLSCDDPGWRDYRREWGWNFWHVTRRLEAWRGAGDGEIVRQVSFRTFRYLGTLKGE